MVHPMTKTDLLRRFNPRVVDFQPCQEWQAESRRLHVRPCPAPAAAATVRVDALPPQTAQRLVRLIGKASGEAWVSDRHAATVGLIIRGRLDAIESSLSRIPNEPLTVRQAAECVLAALEAYQTHTFRLKLKRCQLRLGPRAAVMGIVNVTPDSFSDGGAYFSTRKAVDHVLAMCEAGADIVDVGAESTRPGAQAVDADTERRRVIPVIETLSDRIEQPISIDTSKAEVARDALAAGAQIINDVTGFTGDEDMPAVAADSGAAVIVMHMRGNPRSMQRHPRYRDIMSEITAYLRGCIERAVKAGVKESQIVVDPGIGFGKTVSHNLEIMRRMHEFRSLGRPVLVGSSRKSFIGKVLDAPMDRRLWGTAATVCWAVAHGASVVRVHDVREAVDVVRMTEAMASMKR